MTLINLKQNIASHTGRNWGRGNRGIVGCDDRCHLISVMLWTCRLSGHLLPHLFLDDGQEPGQLA